MGHHCGLCGRKWAWSRLACVVHIILLLCLSCLKPDKFYYLLPLSVGLVCVCVCVCAQYKALHTCKATGSQYDMVHIAH